MLSASGNTNNSNQVIGGGLIGYNSGKNGNESLNQMILTPIGGSSIPESPIMSTSFGNRLGMGEPKSKKLSLALQLSMHS